MIFRSRQQLVAARQLFDLKGGAIAVVQPLQRPHQAARRRGVGQPGGIGQAAWRQWFVSGQQGGLDQRQLSVAGQFALHDRRDGLRHALAVDRRQALVGRQASALAAQQRPTQCFAKPPAHAFFSLFLATLPGSP